MKSKKMAGKRMKVKGIRRKALAAMFMILFFTGTFTACTDSGNVGEKQFLRINPLDKILCTGLENVGERQSNHAGVEKQEKEEDMTTYIGKIIEKRQERGTYLIASDGTEGLLDVHVLETNFIDNGSNITDEAIIPGMTVEVTFDGMVLESYPGQIYASKIEVINREDDLVSLYLDILKQVYENGEGLNGDITMIAVDISKADNLSKGEKEAIIYQAWQLFGMEVIPGTYEELKEQGHISSDGLYFPDGVLLKIETLEIENDSFQFSASKWRSGTGANFYMDCRAEKKEGKYTFELGRFAIA
ncbi:MAG: YobA family protein [Roseburia sp.]|nr:YobA family protein [Roseburia sp.]MCM1278943.1 YobA family protein [Robinsoniella sp.]